MDAFSTTPQANDLMLRHVIMSEYYDTLECSAALEIWYNSPQAARRGNITRKQKEFRTSFLKLVGLTRHISQMAGMEETAKTIDKWYVGFSEDIDEKKYFLSGVKLFKAWYKALFEQKIVEYR